LIQMLYSHAHSKQSNNKLKLNIYSEGFAEALVI